MQQPVVLLIGISPENMAAIQASVQDQNFSIISATSQNEALKLIWEHDIALAIAELQTLSITEEEILNTMAATKRSRSIQFIFIGSNGNQRKSGAAQPSNYLTPKHIYSPFNAAIANIVIKNSISEYFEAKEAANHSATLAQYKALINHAPGILCTLQAKDLSVCCINPAVWPVLGLAPEAFSGQPLYAFTKNGNQSVTYNTLQNITMQAGRHVTFEDVFTNNQGEEIRLHCSAVYVHNQIYLNLIPAASTGNATVEKKSPAINTQSAKDLFLAKVVHEIRTPINGIVDVLNLVNETDLDAAQKELTELAAVNAETLLGIVNDVLDLSKIDAGKFVIRRVKVNLHKLLENIVSLFKIRATDKGIKLIYNIAADVPEFIMADSLRLKQILMNLLNNAIKFTKYGYVNLGVQVLEKTGNKAKIQFTIKDTGIGIPANKLDSIFDIYTQAQDDTTDNFGGTGLGLNVVKQLVQLKGGELSVSSRINKGSTFCFTNMYDVVYEENKGQLKNKDEEKGFESLGDRKVLLVEDNELSHLTMQAIIKKWRIQVDHAINGRQALDMLKQNDYNLILMDTQMPVMNGYETAQAIREGAVPGKSQIPIISVSAGISDEEKQQALDSGMNEIVEKPIQANDLYCKMKAALDCQGE